MPENGIKLLRFAGKCGVYESVSYIAHFHPARAGRRERISQSLQEFMEGVEPSTSRWISAAVDPVIRDLKFDLIVRALYAEETSAAGASSLDRFCEELSRASGKAYGCGRLTKSRPTTALDKISGRPARQKELAGVFHFDGSGLARRVRVLVVDYITATGATAEAVGAAIRTSLPEAEIVGFVFGKVDASIANDHLRAEYFAGNAEDPAAPPPVQRAPDTSRRAQRSLPSRPAERSGVVGTRQASPARRRLSPGTIAVVILAVIFLVIGALVPRGSGKKPVENEIPVLTTVQQPTFDVTEAEPVKAAVPAQEAPRGPQGTVTVPSVGVRVNHSIEAKTIPRVTLRKGEPVTILKRHKPDVGPSWVKVKTRSGLEGWVFASVVQERRSRSL